MTDTEILDWLEEHHADIEPNLADNELQKCITYYSETKFDHVTICDVSLRDCVIKANEVTI